MISGEEEAIKLDKKKPKKKQIKEQKEEKVEQASDEKYTVSSAIELIGMGKYQWILLFLTSFVFVGLFLSTIQNLLVNSFLQNKLMQQK